MTDIANATRYIAVAAPSKKTTDEWGNNLPIMPPIYQDYALMKVLYMLRKSVRAKAPLRVNAFKCDDGLDFSNLQDTDVIFIVGHGGERGLYALGPDATKNTIRLIETLTKDGNLKKKRKDKKITILLLSCRAGLGYHKSVARKLTVALGGGQINAGGALGFTFGSISSTMSAKNEVLIKGIPWRMEYPRSMDSDQEAEMFTAAREKKLIKMANKRKEIEAFIGKKEALEKEMKDLISLLSSTEINNALDELAHKWGMAWTGMIQSQFELYHGAKKHSNLEFDMWYRNLTEAYVWTNGITVTDAEVNALLSGQLDPTDGGLTSIK